MSTEQDDPIAYLTGDGGHSLPADQRADLDGLRAMLADASMWEEPPAGLEESIIAAIGEEARQAGLGSAPASRWGAIRRLGWSRPRLGLAALTAAAAIIALIVVLSLPGTGPPPERFAMVVSGTPLAPRAHGNATLTKHQAGWAIHLSATGLPRLSGSRYYYQAWLKNGDGILVPVGTFNAPQDVSLWSGVPVTQYRTLTVTIQRVGGSPASSGRRVMTGTIESRTR